MKKLYFILIAFLFLSFGHAQIVNIPDPVFKAKLLSASPQNRIARTIAVTVNENGWSAPLEFFVKIDTNNDGEIQVSEASLIKYLDVRLQFGTQISSLEGISSFVNLVSLDCNDNLLTNVNLSALINLKGLRCAYNNITNLNVDGLTNLIALECAHNNLSNINLNGLTQLKIIACQYNQINNIEISTLTNLKKLFFDNNQLTILNCNGLTNLESIDCNNNNITSINTTGALNIIKISCGYNSITSLELNHLKKLVTLSCYNNQLTTLDLSNSKILGLFCSNNQLISINIKNNNNWGAYTLELYISQNPSLKHICVNEFDLAYVQSQIDLAGYTSLCQVNSYCSFTPGGIFYTIQGSNKIDSNNNGCDAADSIYPNLKYAITNGVISGNLISNTSGNYSIPVSAGTHTITPQLENPNYFTISPSSATVSFPATASPFIQNFCLVPNGIHHDLEVVVIPLGVARPGFDATYKIKFKNKGNLNENTTINFNFNDAILDYVSSTVAPTTQATGILSWNVGTLAPFQSGEILVTLNVNSPMETPSVTGGDILSYSATANGLSNDETPDDNTATLSQTVVNSFDPNDKTCLEGNIINPSMIGKYVHYKIRFENTGTFAAQNIVVKDIIDTAKFDIATLQMTDASHSCVTRITNPNKVEFIFENINLPFDDATNDGYVVFKIKTKPTLTLNSIISNLANIYFDYNFPIVTNTATSTFTTLGNDTFEFDTNFTIYPNPVTEVLSINTKQNTQILNLSIYTTLGQLVQTVVNPTSTLDVADLKTGTYFIKITTDKGVSSTKFVKE